VKKAKADVLQLSVEGLLMKETMAEFQRKTNEALEAMVANHQDLSRPLSYIGTSRVAEDSLSLISWEVLFSLQHQCICCRPLKSLSSTSLNTFALLSLSLASRISECTYRKEFIATLFIKQQFEAPSSGSYICPQKKIGIYRIEARHSCCEFGQPTGEHSPIALTIMELPGTCWKVLECSGTFLCKIVYIDLNPSSKRKTGVTNM
jgi:hypothetical protein